MRSSTKSYLITIIAVISIGIISLLVLLPRLCSPTFGLLDDGVTIDVAHYIRESPQLAFTFMQRSGRFFPIYWFWNTAVRQVAGLSPLRWFLVNWLLLCVISTEIFILMRFRGASTLQSYLGGVLFLLSTPIIESFYTLSKSEPLVLLFGLTGVICTVFPKRAKIPSLRILFYPLALILFLLAYLSKEPAIVLVGILLAWMIGARIFPPSPTDDLNLPTARDLFLLSLGGALIFLAARYYFVAGTIAESGYATLYKFSLEGIKNQAFRWNGWIIRNYLYLVPLAALLLIKRIRPFVYTRLLMDSLVWMAGWLAILLPWKALDMYYTLPFSAGAAIMGGILLGAGIAALQKSVAPGNQRIPIYLLLGGACLFGAITLVNNFTTARLQLLYDEVNRKMVQLISRDRKIHDVYFNTPWNEYVAETQYHLKLLYQRSDIKTAPFQFQRPKDNKLLRYLVVGPDVDNLLFPTPRNAVLDESGEKHWNACLQEFLKGKPTEPKIRAGEIYKLDIGVNRLFGRLGLPDFLSSPGQPILSYGTLRYGWYIYELLYDPWDMAQPGVYDSGKWELKLPSGTQTVQMLGQDGDIPLTGDFDGNVWTDLAVFRSTTRVFMLDTDLDGSIDSQLKIDDMREGDEPLVGDWDGDGIDNFGYFRRSDMSWHWRSLNSNGASQYGASIPGTYPDGIPLVGDWDGGGKDRPGMYIPKTGEIVLAYSIIPADPMRPAFTGPKNTIPVVADWYGHGVETIGFYQNGIWTIYPINVFCNFPNPLEEIKFGDPASLPVAGRWPRP